MRKLAIVFMLALMMTPFNVAAAQNTSIDYDQARRDYRLYLEKLKELSEQYKEVTTQITQVMKEEGVPTIDANTGTLTMKPYDQTEIQKLDARIVETDKDMTVTTDLPGLKRESIQIKIVDRKQIRVTALKKNDPNGAAPVERIIDLPSLADEKGTEATYEDGVLTVRVLKTEKKEISIPLSK